MKVAEVRRRLGPDLVVAVRAGDLDSVALAADRLKAVAIGIVGRPPGDEVDLDGLDLSTRAAAAVLGFHPEHVRRLIRGGRLAARREGGDYRVALGDLWPVLEARHRAPGRRRRPAGVRGA